jgi:hypothetical protein
MAVDTGQRGTLLLGRCNPYGAESGGPRHLLGGLYGAASARTPDMHLPENVEQGEWRCDQPAQLRCRMYCACGHKGQVMNLCSWHDEVSYRGEMVAGVLRQVRENIRQRGHFEEIQRRQSSLCPPCAWPAPYAELQKEIQAWQAQLTQYWYAQQWRHPDAQRLRTQIDDAGTMMDQARAAGIIHNCPLTLKAVS